MARTINEIYNSMITEKNTFSNLNELQPNIDSGQQLLSDLTTSSKVAQWRLFLWIAAFAIWIQEKLFDEHKLEVEERAKELIPGVPRWYVDQTKLFQYGDELVWNGDKYVYNDTESIEAANKRIITQSAVVVSNREVNIKVAKGEIGSLSPLTIAEAASVTSYLKKIGIAGTIINLVNLTADDFKYSYYVEYDPLVLDAAGKLIADSVITDLVAGDKPVEIAILNHIQGLEFNSELVISKLTDAIQLAEGVVNVVCNSAEARYGATPYEDILAIPDQSYLARAGYLVVDPASTINYQA